MSRYPCIVLSCGLILVLQPLPALAGQAAESAGMESPVVAASRDGQHDFDSNIGTWNTHLRRLQHPLSGSTTWVEYEGTSVVRELLGGRANLVELEVEGPTGRIDGLLLRLYNPKSRQWRMHYANVASGVLVNPLIGAFKDGRGEFYAQDTFEDRAVLVRFVITQRGPDAWRFEQAFSDDGGRTWEPNWIATDTRCREAAQSGGGGE